MTTAITIYPEAAPSPYQAKRPQAPDIQNDDFFSSFIDLLDILNPLQHIPVISTAYRELTGDKISDGARIAGDTLFGGPLGFGASIINALIAQETGKDIGENLLASLTSDKETAPQAA